jgi:hypothetical protein
MYAEDRPTHVRQSESRCSRLQIAFVAVIAVDGFIPIESVGAIFDVAASSLGGVVIQSAWEQRRISLVAERFSVAVR